MISSCWILCVPRSGSSFLSELLNNTNIFPIYKNNLIKSWNGPLSTNCAFNEWFRVLNLTNIKNNIPFHAKVIYHQFIENFKNISSQEIHALIPNIKFIYLKRSNLIEHATSLYLSKYTNVYHIYDNVKLNNYKKISIKINYNELIEIYNDVLCMSNIWDAFLKNTSYLTVYYEKLQENTQEELFRIFNYLNIKISEEIIQSSIKKVNLSLLKLDHEQKNNCISILKQNKSLI